MSNSAHAASGEYEWAPSLPIPILAMWVFLASEVMFFGALIGSYVILRSGMAAWPPMGDPALPKLLTGINTVILVSSSFTFEWAHRSVRKGNVSALKTGLIATILLGGTFLGIQAYEWTHLVHDGLAPAKSTLGACFFTLTGFHGLHVLGGVVALVSVWTKAMRGRYSQSNDVGVHMVGLYWHFVDVVWIVLFLSLYIL